MKKISKFALRFLILLAVAAMVLFLCLFDIAMGFSMLGISAPWAVNLVLVPCTILAIAAGYGVAFPPSPEKIMSGRF